MNRHTTRGQGRWLGRRLTVSLAGLAFILTAAGCSQGPATAAHTARPAASTAKLRVTSTLDGLTGLPHRIHWQAFPSGPSSDLSQVDYLIDGQLRWIEHSAPYFYGSDGNYLVTSFLTPGAHTFTVRAIWADGTTATDTARAQVSPAPAPPAALAGTWQRFHSGGDLSSPPSGYWRLIITSVGWQINDTSGGGNLLDIGYLSPGLLEIRQGMFTSPDSQLDGNGWCNNDPGPTVRLRYTIQGNTLTFTPISPLGCDGTDYVTGSQWRGTWTRVSG